MDSPTSEAPSKRPPPPDPRRRRALLRARLLVALSSALGTCLLLEVLVRLLVAPPSPRKLRDGIYVSQLAKVNGRETVLVVEGNTLLPEKKRPGEVRIFVFGESSVQGSPWGYRGSPPTMLYDQLRAVAPDADVTVVNMGRGAGYMIDSYYFMASIARFAPDYVIVYQGGNDAYADPEMCMPATHPVLYRGWRWLVEHSRLAWTVRTQGPSVLAGLHPPRSGSAATAPEARTLCDDATAFRGWSDILIETAQRMGARVIMTTPVQNPLRWAELSTTNGVSDVPLRPMDNDEHYRKLLACVLTEGCDLVATWDGVRHVARAPNGYRPDFWVEPRTRAMLDAADAHGVRAIDLVGHLNATAAGGLSPPWFSDEVHMSLGGYWRLAWLWATFLGEDLGRGPVGPPPAIDADRYLRDILAHGGNGGFGGDGSAGRACLLLPWANVYLRTNMSLIAGSLLMQAVALDAPPGGGLPTTSSGREARLLVGWLRQQGGLDPALPPALASKLGDIDMMQVTRALREHPDCSTLTTAGGAPAAAPSEEPRPASESPGHDAGRADANPPRGDDPRDDGPLDSTRFAIGHESESLVAEMLGRQELGGCAFEGAEIRKSFVHAKYRCPGDRSVAIELHHPSHAAKVVAKTSKFDLVEGAPPPPEPLVGALADRIRGKEARFTWLVVNQGTRDDATKASPEPGSRRLGPALVGVGALALGSLALASWLRRRRKVKGDHCSS